MSQPCRNSHGQRRISTLLFSLLRRVSGWLDGWLRQRQARLAGQPAQPNSTVLHFEALEPRLLLSADLVAGSLNPGAFAAVVPGDHLSALFEVHRPDNEPLASPVRIEMYASTDSTLDAGDRLIGRSDVAADRLQPGVNRIRVNLNTRGITEPGRYTLIGVVDPNQAIAESNESNNQSIADQRPIDLQFAVGQLVGRSPLPSLNFTDADGSRQTLTIAGAGVARLEADAAGYHLRLSGTDLGTRIALTGSGGGDERLVLTGITADGPLGSLLAPSATLTGAATFTTLDSLSLGEIATGARLTGDVLSTLRVSRDALGELRLSGRGASDFVLGSAEVGGALGGLWSITGNVSSISAGSTRLDWHANLSEGLTRFVVRGDGSGQLASAALHSVQVGGSLRRMALRIGADLGSDATLGGDGSAANSFHAGTLGSLRVDGDIADSLIVVGVDPRNGGYLDGDDRQLGDASSRLQELVVGGQLKGDTHLIAPAFPDNVRIEGVLRDPASVSQLVTSTPLDRVAPTLSAGLLDDSGRSDSDGVTSQPSIGGTVTDSSPIASLRGGFAANAVGLVDILDALQPDGRFSLSASRLATLNGGSLPDGSHTLRLQASDRLGNSSPIVEVPFTLDTTAPPAPSFGLASSSDSAVQGDGITSAARVTLTGAAETGVTLSLGNRSVLAGAGGVFQMPDVALDDGQNTLTLLARDAAGNATEASIVVHRAGVVTTDVALTWNQLTLDAIRLTVSDPPAATRILAMVSLAQYDTLAAIEGTPPYLVRQTVSGPVAIDAALAQAAYSVLSAVFPGQRVGFAAALAQTLAGIPEGEARTNALALGRLVGESVLAIRGSDGATDFADYAGSTRSGMWRPTAPTFEVADDPQWADVAPFALSSPDQFRPAAPPSLASALYAQSVEEVRSLGAAGSGSRSAEQTAQAQFWADGKGSYTPPGHWNLITQQVALAQGSSLTANVRLFAQLNVALADAAIAAWDAKYSYGLWRPIDAIANADQDDNAATSKEAGWTPLLITPPHPEYVSGHSTFSAAAASILADAFGDATAFSSTSFTYRDDSGNPVTRDFASFSEAAQEAGRSRIYGGIHFEFTNQAGLTLGQQVASAVLARFALNSDSQAPTVTAAETPAVSNANLTLAGQILDNLSGVASAQFRIDAGPLQDLTLDAPGHFSVTTAFALDGSAEGLHTLSIVASDAAGNLAAGFTRSFTLDTLAPALTLTSLPDAAALAAASRLTGTADPTGSTLTVLSYRFDNDNPRNLTFNNATGSFDEPLLLGNLAAGAHTVTLMARDAAGNEATLSRNVTLAQLAPFSLRAISPVGGASDVGVTFRPQIVFSRAVDPSTLTADSFYATGPDGQRLAATLVPALDGSFAWLFFSNPLPGASQITMHVEGDLIRADAGGTLLDADGDGSAGGMLSSTFITVSRAAIPGTTLVGKVVDPGPDLEPMTFDDIRRGADGIIHTADDVFLNPIEHAKVYILGQDDRFVFTDASGNFTLSDVPAGTVKVAVDGRTATNAPAGLFFPEMVMDLTLEPGLENTVMGSMGQSVEQRANETRREVYLPRLQRAILTDVAGDSETVVGVTAESAPNLSDEQRQRLTLTVQPGTLIGEDGQILDNGLVGISTVPPELVRDMLPPGVLEHTFDITIQAPGVLAFAQPLQVSFPNTTGAAPGAQLNIMSFDHTSGRLVISGTATVSADGKSVRSDEGSGIRAPGWHWLARFGDLLSDFGTFVADWLADPCVNLALKTAGVIAGGVGLVASSPAWVGGAAVAGAGIGIATTISDGLRGDLGVDDLPVGAKDRVKRVVEWIESYGARKYEVLNGTLKNLYSLAKDPSLSRAELAAILQQIKRIDSPINGALNTAGAIEPFGKLVKTVGKRLGVGGFVLDLSEIPEAIENCFGADLSQLPQAMRGAYDDLTHALGNLGRAVERTFTPIEQAIDRATKDGLARVLQELGDGPYWTVPENGNLLIYDGNGFPVPDPETGRPRHIPIGETIDPDLQPGTPAARELLDLVNRGIEHARGVPDGGGQPIADDSLDHAVDTVIAALIRIIDGLNDLGPRLEAGPQDLQVMVQDVVSGNIIYRGPHARLKSDPLLLAAGEAYVIEAYSLSAKLYGVRPIIIPAGGGNPGAGYLWSLTASMALMNDISPDADGDGLSDNGERVFGTNGSLADSDGDGVSDLAEILAGTDPLGGRALPTGIVSSLVLPGEAKAIALTGGLTGASNQTAFVATGSYGLSIVDAAQFRTPRLLAQIELSGDARSVAVDATLGIAAVAAGSGGLHLLDVANPAAPVLFNTIAVNASHVLVFEGVAQVAAGSELHSYDLLTGERLATVSLAGTITGLARAGSHLYASDSERYLWAIDTAEGGLRRRGSLRLPAAAVSLFVADGIAYAGAGDGGFGGFMTARVTDPLSLQILSGVDNNSIAGTAIALDGSGLGLVAGSSYFGAGFQAVDLVDVTDPSNTGRLIGRVNLPQAPYDIAIGAGIAFVADGTGGLQVVNYLGADNLGAAPLASAELATSDIDPLTPGTQILEGSTVSLRTTVSDDVQVRNVDLLRDGQVVLNDTGYPFELGATLPTIAANDGSTTVTLQVRATDTGGNFGLSAPIEVELVPDTFAPQLVATSLNDGAVVGRSFRAVTFDFSEAIDPAALGPAAIQIVDANGHAVSPQNVQFRFVGKQVQATVAPLPVGDYTLRIDAAQIRDRAGNALGGAALDSGFSVRQFSVEWINPAGGNWNTAANWSTGIVPLPTDDVFIGLPENVTVTINSGSVQVASLISNENLTLAGGTLNVSGEARIDGTFRMTGGTLTGSGVLLLTATGNQWTGGVMSGGGTTSIAAGADLTISGGARKTLANRTLRNEGTLVDAQAASGYVELDGAAVIDNVGVFDIRSDASWENYYNPAGTLTLNNSGTLRKSAGSGEFQFLSTALNNSGTVEVQIGRLAFGGDGGVSTGSFSTVAGSAVVFQTGTQTWQTGARATGAGAIELGFLGNWTGTLTVAGDVEVSRLDLNWGTLTGSGTLSVTGSGSQWLAGTMTGGGTTRIASGADLTVSGDERKNVANRTLINQGTLIDAQTAGGYVELDGAAVLDNVGVFDIRSDESWQNYYNPAGTLTLNNPGVVRKSSGSGDFVFFNTTINQSGEIVVSSGTLALASGQANLLDGSSISGPNAFTLSGGTLTIAADEEAFVDKLSIESGTVTGAGTLTLTGSGSQWSGGVMTGGGTTRIASGADLTISTNRSKNLVNRTLRNEGTLIDAQTAGGYVELDGAAFLDNVGVFDIRSSDASWETHYAPAGTLTLNNSGTLRKSAGSGEFQFLSTALNNSGTVEVQVGRLAFGGDGGVSTGSFSTVAGSAVVFQTGTQTWQTGARATGAGAIELGFLGNWTGTLTVAGDVEVSRLDLNWGTLTGSGTLTLTGSGSQWLAGTMTGGGTTRIASGADLTVGGTPSKALANRTLRNDGLLIDAQTASGYVELDGAAVIDNVGVFDIRSDASWENYYNPAGTLTLNNSGTLRKSAGSGEFQFLSTALNNSGTVEVQIGRLAFGGDGGVSTGSFSTVAGSAVVFQTGTQTWQTGARATGAGAIELGFLGISTGTLAVAGEVEVNRLDINRGTLTGSGTLTLTGSGSEWLAGTMTGGGTTRIASGADLTVSGDERKNFANRTLINQGTLIDAQTAAGEVELDGAAVLDNVGVFDIRSDESWRNRYNPAGTLALNNSGTLRKSAGVGDFIFADTSLNNSGTIQVLAGVLLVNGLPV